MPLKVIKQQMGIWELFDTECAYLKTLKAFIEVFFSCLANLKENEETSELFQDIDLKKLFCNIIDLFNCSISFWQSKLHPIVESLRKSKCSSSASSTSTSTSSPKDLIVSPVYLIDAFSNVYIFILHLFEI